MSAVVPAMMSVVPEAELIDWNAESDRGEARARDQMPTTNKITDIRYAPAQPRHRSSPAAMVTKEF